MITFRPLPALFWCELILFVPHQISVLSRAPSPLLHNRYQPKASVTGSSWNNENLKSFLIYADCRFRAGILISVFSPPEGDPEPPQTSSLTQATTSAEQFASMVILEWHLLQ
jgi:hypothetical protein